MERAGFSIKKGGNVVISKAKEAERRDSDLGVKSIFGPGGVGPSAAVRDMEIAQQLKVGITDWAEHVLRLQHRVRLV